MLHVAIASLILLAAPEVPSGAPVALPADGSPAAAPDPSAAVPAVDSVPAVPSTADDSAPTAVPPLPVVKLTDGGLNITIVRADKVFPPPVPLGLLPAAPPASKALWPKDLIALADLAPAPISEAYGQAREAFDAALYSQTLTILDAEAQRAPLSLEARYLRSLALLRVGLSAEAARELISLADLIPALRARCFFSAAVALEDQKAFATAAEVYAKAVAAGPEASIHRDALLGEARMRLASGGTARAEEILTQIADVPAPTMGFGRDVGAEASLSLAQLLERRGQGKKAAKLYRDLWLKHPLSALAEPAEERARALGLPAAPAAEQVTRAELVLTANRNVQAIALLTPLAAALKLKPRAAGACEAHFALGKALKKQRRHTEALREFGSVIDACKGEGDQDLRARTLYLAGQSAAVVDPPRAKKLFTALAEAYPGNSFADDALFFAADVEAKNLGEPDLAKARWRSWCSAIPAAIMPAKRASSCSGWRTRRELRARPRRAAPSSCRRWRRAVPTVRRARRSRSCGLAIGWPRPARMPVS